MKLGRFTKTPTERKRYSLDYADWLDTSETIATVTFGVTPVTDNPLIVDAYLIATPATSVAFFINNGITGTTYTLDIQITTSGGQTKEDQILYSVRDL